MTTRWSRRMRLTLARASVGVFALAVLCSVGCASPPADPSSRAASSPTAAPRFAPSGPNAAHYGEGAGFPMGDRTSFWEVPHIVGSFSHLDQVFEGRLIRKAATPSRLARAASEPAISWELFRQETFTLDDYLARNPATGLLIARDDTILVERYQYSRTDRHRLTSWSMAKTVTAMLIGIAIAEGHIRSVDETAATYVRALAGTEYGGTSLRHLLQMSSGVRFSEGSRRADDVMKLVLDTYIQVGAGGVGAVTSFNERVVPAGTMFAYASIETQVLGLVLRAVVGRPVAEYLQEKIWQPIGAEADATWLVDRSGQEAAFCCLNAVLRDYARLGLLLAHDGNWRGRQIIPAAWIRDATTVRADQPYLVATGFLGFDYGYQTWIIPGERRMFALIGVRGQAIFVDPKSRLVMVHTAVHRQPVDYPQLWDMMALWRGVVRELGG